MCGIVGVIGREEAAVSVFEMMKRLEYRGYDSAGIATLKDGVMARRRAKGKMVNLKALLDAEPLEGVVSIGQTRWATHGAPTEANAHPHSTDRVAIAHNGIIENFADLRAELIAEGRVFESETDTEVVPQLVTHLMMTQNLGPKQAFMAAVKRLTGAYALAAIFPGNDGFILCARQGSPLAIGRGEGEMFLGSDAYALAPFTNLVTYLAEGDLAEIRRDGFDIFDVEGNAVSREEQISQASAMMVDKGGHRHFMAKEIHEQVEVVGHTLSAYIDPVSKTISLPADTLDFTNIDRLTMSACGTAFYAGLISKYWFEKWARLPIEIDVASELRYRDMVYTKNGGALFISQSGETADTLAALRDAKENGQMICSIVNVPESTIARESHGLCPTYAGPEIGVASTKAFTCQLAALACVAIAAGKQRGTISPEEENRLVTALLEAPRQISEALKSEADIKALADDIAKARDVLYLGRGVSYPMALEGALKLKEISYIHAEGYAAGELKHGPIALIDEDVPVIVVAPDDDVLFEKTISNMHEVMARGGKCLLVSSEKGIAEAEKGGKLWRSIAVPETDPMLSPLAYSVPIQLLAYYTACSKGTDVDQPRNLAKSVTVE